MTGTALVGLLITAVVSLVVLKPVISQAVAASTGSASTGTASTGKADFSVTASPRTQSVQQGKSVSYEVFVTAVNGFAGTVDLSTGPLPSGVSGSPLRTVFDMRQGSQQSTTWTMTAARGTALQTYDLQVSGTSGRTVRTAALQLSVEKTPGALAVALGPATATVAPGGSVVYEVTLNRTGSYTDAPVALSVSGLPTGARAVFGATSPTVASSTSLQIDLAASTPDAVHAITVTATAAGQSFTAGSQLVVSYSSRAFTTAGTALGVLAPGAPAAPVALTFSNGNNRPLAITNVTMAVTAVVPLDGRTCSTSDFAVTKQYTGPYPIQVPASGTRTLDVPGADRSLWPHLVLVNKAVNQDGCKGARVSLSFSGTGQGD